MKRDPPRTQRTSPLLSALLFTFGASCGEKAGGPLPSISVSATPNALSLQQGTVGTVAVTLSRTGNVTGNISLVTEGLPAGATATVTPSALTASTATATVSVTVAASTAPGTYAITIRASGANLAPATAVFALEVTASPAYTLTAEPGSLTISQGLTGTATIHIARVNYTGPVALTLETSLPGVMGTFLPSPATGGTSIVTVSVARGVSTGTYTLTARATAAGLADRTVTLTLSVTPEPNYELALAPNARTINAGESGSATINIERTNFTGAVALSIESPPPGVMATFQPASTIGNASDVTVTVATTVAPGLYTLTVVGMATGVPSRPAGDALQGTAAAGERRVTLALTVAPAPAFSLTVSPSTVTIAQAASGAATIGIARVNFTDAVAISLVSPPTGISASFAPSQTAGSTSVITVAVSANVPAGSYTLTIRAIGGGREQTTPLSVNVSPQPDYSLAATPTSITVPPGGSQAVTMTISRVNFIGGVALALLSPPNGITASFVPATATGATAQATIAVATTVAPGLYVVTIQGSAPGLGYRTALLGVAVAPPPSVTLSLSASQLTIQQGATGQVTLTLVRTNFTGSVTPSATGQPAGLSVAFNPNPITGTTAAVAVTAGGGVVPGTYSLTIAGNAGAAGTPTAQLQVVVTPSSNQSLLFRDTFNVLGTKLNLVTWTTEIGMGSFLGRTQLADWVTPGGVGQFIVGTAGAEVALNTYNPTGFSLFGTHGKTRVSFRPTANSTIVYTARLRLEPAALQRGVVFGIYFFGCPGYCATNHDEIDIELVTNMLQGAPYQVQLNRYADEPLGAGHGGLVNLPPGFDPLATHDWTIRWSLAKIEYLLDGVLLATETTVVPQGPMWINVNAWGPDTQWPAAYHASLQPTAMAGANQRFVAYLTLVEVHSVP